DLHAAVAVVLPLAGRIHGIAVGGQVVDVEEQAQVSLAGAVHRGDGVRGGLQRVGVGSDRLDQDGAANPGDGLGGQCEILGGNLVLLLRGDTLQTVAVQGVEPLAAGAFADTGDRVEVVPELLGAFGPRDQSALTTGHVAGVEVQAGQLHTGVGDRGHERVFLVLAGDRGCERPPELHAVESGRFGCGGAL